MARTLFRSILSLALAAAATIVANMITDYVFGPEDDEEA
jgi:hypothetical protein